MVSEDITHRVDSLTSLQSVHPNNDLGSLAVSRAICHSFIQLPEFHDEPLTISQLEPSIWNSAPPCSGLMGPHVDVRR